MNKISKEINKISGERPTKKIKRKEETAPTKTKETCKITVFPTSSQKLSFPSNTLVFFSSYINHEIGPAKERNPFPEREDLLL